ncbi:MAG TPA: ABC transporter ATP-binding protein [Erysipelotrichaceae bacterium]|nr:ABC transporter ATP-binding protein [Erysipelotrichaceae bacterium]
MLKIEHLNKNFKTKEVLKDLNLEVHDGSIFGLVGINGAGKSTLLRLIAGVYEPEGGSITLNGTDTWKDPEIRRDIAFVSDEQYYPIGCTIKSLKLLYESMYNFDEAAWHKYMEMFDLEPGMSITNLSKGMKRRVSLLYALSIHPKLILLDEAYDGLEPLARLHFKQALTDLIEDENISVVISSHNLKELEDICDSFGILEDGHIISYGDLLESRELINKYQVVFKTEHTKEDFKDFDILHFEQEGRVCKLVIRGNEEEVTAKLDEMEPVLMDVLQTNFEELFIYELESRGETK